MPSFPRPPRPSPTRTVPVLSFFHTPLVPLVFEHTQPKTFDVLSFLPSLPQPSPSSSKDGELSTDCPHESRSINKPRLRVHLLSPYSCRLALFSEGFELKKESQEGSCLTSHLRTTRITSEVSFRSRRRREESLLDREKGLSFSLSLLLFPSPSVRHLFRSQQRHAIASSTGFSGPYPSLAFRSQFRGGESTRRGRWTREREEARSTSPLLSSSFLWTFSCACSISSQIELVCTCRS